MTAVKTTTLEKSKHELGDLVVIEDHHSETGIRFYTVEFRANKKALKKNPKLPILLSVTESSTVGAKASLAKQLDRYK